MNQYLKYAGVALAAVIATVGVSKAVHHGMDKGIGHFANADADNNGEITRAEWTAAANTRFDALDSNKDGKIVVGEIPGPGPRGHRRGPHGPSGPGDDWAPDEQPPVPAPVGNTAIGNNN